MPKTVSNRSLRRTVVEHQKALEDGFAPALRSVIQNEAATRERVSRVEAWKEAADARVFRPTVWGRLRWLFTGR